MAKVSVIIAVYRAEEFIERCARSLFGQTLGDMEFIFVDDCSPDRSIEVMLGVLEEFPWRKPQVKVIRHERNRGVSITRQDGVDAATGEYLIHCDPDDWVDIDAYETVYDEAVAHDADFVLFDDYRTLPESPSDATEYDSITLLSDFSGLSGKTLYAGLCRNIVRAEVAKAATIPAKVCNGEDINFMFQILRNPLKIRRIHRKFYHYFSNPHSLTKQKTALDLERDYVNIELLEQMRFGDNRRYDRCVDSFIFAIICTRAFNAQVYTNAEFKRKYGRFSYTWRYYKRGKFLTRLLVWASMKGLYRQAWGTYAVLAKIQTHLKR